jgi:hypothetical protein
MEAYLEDNRHTLDEVCIEYEKCIEDCPAYGFCHNKEESEK